MSDDTTACKNTDREIWREREGDYYADSIHVTEGGGIGIDCGGSVYVKPVREWHRLAGGPISILGRDTPETNRSLESRFVGKKDSRGQKLYCLRDICNHAVECKTGCQHYGPLTTGNTPEATRLALADRLSNYRVWNARAGQYDAVPLIVEAAAALRSCAGPIAAGERGNYEGRHPNDMVLHPLSEIREWDEALAVLGIQDSDQTPADAIRELNAEIERLSSPSQAPVQVSDTLIQTNLIVCLDMLREACSPFVPSSGKDNEWLSRRDRVVSNADAALAPPATGGEK
jgi:hypothetical protein